VTAARFSTNSMTALRAAAIAGVGLIRGSTLVVGGALREGALVHLLEEHTTAEFGIFAVYPAGRQALPKVKAFVDFLLRDLAPRLAPAEP
jgi:DNA-binding transcriptional LysR family regulator